MVNEFLNGWEYFQFVLALMVIIISIFSISFFSKKFLNLKYNRNTNNGAVFELKVINSLMIDAKRRAIVLQHGKDKHVLLLGPNNDILVSSPSQIADNNKSKDFKDYMDIVEHNNKDDDMQKFNNRNG